ncbi:MAG: exonuclease domain-containing protein [Kiritimatiellae bacterium]|nr:exonuclease domain-containing protein [Kiritimatiellia bacterium]
MFPVQTDRPIAFFDIESTGINIYEDRIIDLAIVLVHPDGRREEHTYRVNPGRPIPVEASRVHGIYDDDVKDCPTFDAVARNVAAVLENADLGGYNIARFDVPLLEREMERAGVPFSGSGRRIVDAQRIFHRREPRDLTAALKFYTGKAHDGAHGALADVLATLDVLEGQYKRYEDLPRPIGDLHEYCNPKDPTWVDSTGRLKWVNGEVTINFGSKQRGKKLRDIVKFEPGFLRWMLDQNFPRDTMDIVGDALKGKFPSPPPSPTDLSVSE